jgi:hypothetical protein
VKAPLLPSSEMAKASVVEGFYEAMPLVKSENPAESISTQSRLGTKLKIEFAPDRLRYTISDHSGSRTFDAFYETLKVDSFPTLTMRRTIWRPRVLYAAIGIFLLATIVSNISKPLAGLLVIVAALLAPLYWLGQVFGFLSLTFTQIEMNPSPPGSGAHLIRILKDKDHDEILAEVMRRWKARMALLYGNVNLQADVERETKKFEWLRQRGVIDEERFQRALRILNASKARPSEGSTLN